jgi:hypothetical protein
MGARLIALANVIDMLREDDDGAASQAAIGSELVRRAGRELDPDLVRVWLRLGDRRSTAGLQ